MNFTINAKQLRAQLPKLVAQVRQGACFTVLYRSRPAFRILPLDDAPAALGPLEQDPVYRMEPVGEATEALPPADQDKLIYGQ